MEGKRVVGAIWVGLGLTSPYISPSPFLKTLSTPAIMTFGPYRNTRVWRAYLVR